MQVYELVDQLLKLPATAEVLAVPRDCCGCSARPTTEVVVNDDGTVEIVGHRSRTI